MSLPPVRCVGRRASGQSLVEFSLLLPVILLMFLGIADLSRLYTAMFSVEAAAREAADFGAFRSDYWSGDPSDSGSNYAKTVAAMEERACVAASSLPDYRGPDAACVNPQFAFQLVNPGVSDCADPTNATPCQVKVTLTYTFRLILPFWFTPQLTFDRDSTFALSDFEID